VDASVLLLLLLTLLLLALLLLHCTAELTSTSVTVAFQNFKLTCRLSSHTWSYKQCTFKRRKDASNASQRW
jgi:hypothetical protein